MRYVSGALKSKARLAHATGTGQRHEADVVALQKVADGRDVSLAADQWCERNGERGS